MQIIVDLAAIFHHILGNKYPEFCYFMELLYKSATPLLKLVCVLDYLSVVSTYIFGIMSLHSMVVFRIPTW